jgi:hypothetical protein
MAIPFGENAAGVRSCDGEEFPRGQRVLSGVSELCAELCVKMQSKMLDTVPVEIAVSNAALIP